MIVGGDSISKGGESQTGGTPTLSSPCEGEGKDPTLPSPYEGEGWVGVVC